MRPDNDQPSIEQTDCYQYQLDKRFDELN